MVSFGACTMGKRAGKESLRPEFSRPAGICRKQQGSRHILARLAGTLTDAAPNQGIHNDYLVRYYVGDK